MNVNNAGVVPNVKGLALQRLIIPVLSMEQAKHALQGACVH